MDKHYIMTSKKKMVKDTLVRYNTPIVVASRREEKMEVEGLTHKQGLSSFSEKDNIQEVLNCIFPPRQWEENGVLWMQTVSNQLVTEQNVKELGEELDRSLQREDARETGICPLRRKLYDQCFDELVRQETLNCCEQGLLLKSIRDNLRMELNAFETLYESCLAYALRKTLLVEEEKSKLIECIAEEKEKKIKLENHIEELTSKIEQFQLHEAEHNEHCEEEHQKEVELLKQENKNLMVELEQIIYPKTKK